MEISGFNDFKEFKEFRKYFFIFLRTGQNG